MMPAMLMQQHQGRMLRLHSYPSCLTRSVSRLSG
jgi:hypothetical protein